MDEMLLYLCINVNFSNGVTLEYIRWQVSETTPSKDDAMSTPSQHVVGVVNVAW